MVLLGTFFRKERYSNSASCLVLCVRKEMFLPTPALSYISTPDPNYCRQDVHSLRLKIQQPEDTGRGGSTPRKYAKDGRDVIKHDYSEQWCCYHRVVLHGKRLTFIFQTTLISLEEL